MAANQTNIENLNRLRDQGYKWTEIAETLGVTPRFLYAIRRGDKPGDNLQRTITQWAQEGTVPSSGAERRTTASGGPQRVRGQSDPKPRVRKLPKRTPNGGFMSTASGSRAILNDLDQAAREGLDVKITLRVARVRGYKGGARTNVDVTIFGHGGNARNLRNAILQAGRPSVGQALMDIAREAHDLDSIEGFQYAKIHAADRSVFNREDERRR